MSLTRISPRDAREKASELRNLNAQFKAKTDALETAEGTLGTKWEGDAKKAFHDSFMIDKSHMDEFYKIIEQYCVTLENIAIRLENADRMGAEIAGA